MEIVIYYKNENESMCEYTADSVPRIGEKLYLQIGSSCDTYLVIEVIRAIINNEITCMPYEGPIEVRVGK